MRTDGHTYVFRKTDDEVDEEYRRDEEEDTVFHPLFHHEDTEHDNDNSHIYEWISEIHLENRGPELPGLINSQVLQVIICEQSKAWEEIATKYFDDILGELKTFQKELLPALVSDERVLRNIESMLELRSEGIILKITS